MDVLGLNKKEYDELYYQKNREKLLNKVKTYRQNNKDEIRKRQKDYRVKHPEYVRQLEKKSYNKHIISKRDYSRRYCKKLKMEVLTHYGGSPPKCACCGESIIGFLTIDHIDGNGHRHRSEINRFEYNFYVWLRKTGYPKGFQVLCYNCNCGKKGNKGVCPHGQTMEIL